MVTENKVIYTEETTPIEGHAHATSWFGKIIESIQDLDTEFPLSGGEDGHPHVRRKHHTPVVAVTVPQPEKTVTVPVSEEHPHHTSWFSHLIEKIQDLDTDFPLSGGEHVVSHH